ncbi:class I SAM-dependent methyltransferase [Halegenticoccus soli]|uniref:class I SAM-dependent methyltransferase n=1 Tax=Halegenticoccus soli TaxID=1985678 RepID=UPI000C6C9F0D|nr:class I SAM-dependent methyltransferase [Halegenticoccus soli]
MSDDRSPPTDDRPHADDGRSRGSAGDDRSRKRTTAESFGRAAEAYFESSVHREGDDLDRIGSWCADANRALDVATGAGHTAGAIAAAGVPTVVAADISPEMIDTAATAYDGVLGVVADAERLPFADDSFDAVACRIAAHHFPDPEAFVAEVARVLSPGGVFAFEDNVVPEDERLATFLNGIERLRDPTHVRHRSVSRWRGWFADAGLSVRESSVANLPIEYEPWVERTSVPPDRRRELEARFAGAPDAAVDLFEIETDADGVRSFSIPKALIEATAEE